MDDITNLQDLRNIRDKNKNQTQPTENTTDNSVSTNNSNNTINTTTNIQNNNNNTVTSESTVNEDNPLVKNTAKIYDELVNANDKIAKFTELMKEKFNIKTGNPERIEPTPEQQPTTTPEESLTDNSDDKKEKKEKPKTLKERVKTAVMSTKLGRLITVVGTGFKGIIGVGNKITSTLFKMSITAAIATLKTAAMITALVVGFDLIRIYLKYFIDWIGKKWDELTKSWQDYFKDFGKFGTYLDSIETGIGEVVNAFKTGDFPALAKAIIGATARNFNVLIETIRLAIVHGLAGVVRALGFKDTADSMDAAAEQRYADNTHGNLTPEEQKNVAKRQSEDIKNNNDYQNRGLTSMLPDSVRVSIGAISQTDANMAEAEKKATPALQKMTDTDRESSLIKINEVKKLMYDYQQHAGAVNVGNAADVKRFNEEYNLINTKLSDKVFDQVPQIRSAIQTELFQAKQSVDIRTPQPVTPSKQEDVQRVQQIQKNQDADIAGIRQAQNNTANVNNTKVVNNKSIHMQNPITGSRAPGVFGLGGIN